MPDSPPTSLTREQILQALAERERGIGQAAGGPGTYELIHEGRRYAADAVVDAAWRLALGQGRGPEGMPGAGRAEEAHALLTRLGFTVVLREDSSPAVGRGSDWSLQEVRLLVVDYFAMLEAELLGRAFKKSQHRDQLLQSLPQRSRGSVEFKHANVSGVLVDLGLPYIEGYKPRSNYQGLLVDEVEAYLEQRPEFLRRLEHSVVLNPTERVAVPGTSLGSLIEPAPERIHAATPTGKPWLSRRGRHIDFVARDAANRRLGEIGEQFALDLERHRLQSAGRDDLAARVVWASHEYGDGLGYDILSFDERTEQERMIEVKATGLGKFFPFLVTANEVRCSDDLSQQYQLYRVFDLSRSPRLYILHGSLRQTCELDPVVYRASL